MARNSRTFNTRQVMAGFGVSDMTIYNWRQGGRNGKALPTEQQGRLVVFHEDKVQAWAKEQGLKFIASAASAVEGPKVAGVKPAAKKAPVVAKKAVPVKKEKPKAKA